MGAVAGTYNLGSVLEARGAFCSYRNTVLLHTVNVAFQC
ncbi:protein of unknown function [Shewanella benthica]|uniref:Uncharacterized protein n=1 Tax=Shewanella benthica TaxID=43661 RepID=A0A330M3T5_9GAMM|nr:protein of unknown function [Shewanella benthica]